MHDQLGQYKILDRIGAGGTGEVYRARDTRTGRTVALKKLRPDPAAPDRPIHITGEGPSPRRLSHPNIPETYEVVEEQGQAFLAMEFVPGDTLTKVISGRPLNPRTAVDVAAQVADALAEAHSLGIIHGDINPDNIIVTPKGSAKVLDFRLSARTTSGRLRQNAATMPDARLDGPSRSLAYMSPEQARGEAADDRTDVFSLGVVLFEMLTGRLPFSGTTTAAVAREIVSTPAPSLTSVNASLPPELDPILRKALAKRANERYDSAATMAAELRSVGAVLDVRSDVADEVAAGSSWRTSGGVLSRVVLLLVLASIGAGAWWERASVGRIWRRTIGSGPAPLIAVTPLSLTGPSDTEKYFADGLTEDLMTRLGQTPGLKVIGRSAMRGSRGRGAVDVARELGAAVVLTGSVQPRAGDVSISLELVDPSDGSDVWTGQYTRDLTDIFQIQAQIAEGVARALRVTPRPTGAALRAAERRVDPQAYRLYLRGREAAAGHELPRAIGLFQQAVAADGGLVEALAGLADALNAEGVEVGDPDEPSRLARIRAAAQRATDLDPDLPQTNLATGRATAPLPQALASMRRAIDADPSYAEGYYGIGREIAEIDPTRALAFYRRSLSLDPGLAENHAGLGTAFLLLDRPEDARRETTAGGDPSPIFPITMDLAQRRYDEAVAGAARQPRLREAPTIWLLYVVALRGAGRSDDAFREATALVRRFPGFCGAGAVLAGLTLERRSHSAARQIAEPILARARSSDARGSVLGCAASAAAAMNNATEAAALLDRISGNERWLRIGRLRWLVRRPA
jgi:eukaryotic-like serine/threonine-protein kinase